MPYRRRVLIGEPEWVPPDGCGCLVLVVILFLFAATCGCVSDAVVTTPERESPQLAPIPEASTQFPTSLPERGGSWASF